MMTSHPLRSFPLQIAVRGASYCPLSFSSADDDECTRHDPFKRRDPGALCAFHHALLSFHGSLASRTTAPFLAITTSMFSRDRDFVCYRWCPLSVPYVCQDAEINGTLKIRGYGHVAKAKRDFCLEAVVVSSRRTNVANKETRGGVLCCTN